MDHNWPRDIRGARSLQRRLSGQVRLCAPEKEISSIAGVDASFASGHVFAAASLFSYPLMEHLADAVSRKKITFPYVPGLLTFREGPVIVEAVGKLIPQPDLILFDGQGIAHPLGMGIATHIGLLLGIPAVGCAKSRLVGEYAEPGLWKGDYTPLIYKGRQVGVVLRTRDRVKPVFISPGYLTDIPSSISIVLQSLGKYRLPEPIRRADRLSRELARRNYGG